MKFRVEKDVLSEAVAWVARGLPSKPPTPILAGAHVVASREGGGSLKLSNREMDVLVGLSQGLTREEIAGAASILPNTVKSVTRSVYNKLGAMNKADAVRIATQRGIL